MSTATVLRAESALIRKIQTHQARIGVVGLGYVGLPLVLRFTEVGFSALGFDIDEVKVKALNRGESYIRHVPASAILDRTRRTCKLEDGTEIPAFRATSDFSRAAEVDALVICVPTPLNKQREPDLTYVRNTVDALMPHIRNGQLISLESTSYPGTTEEELQARVEQRGFVVGRDVFVVFSPEREDPGNAKFHTQNIPKVCGGATSACLELGVALYGEIIDEVVPVSSTRAAEMTKLLENIYRAVNIGLVNELKIVADRMGIDIREVIAAAATKPFGYTPFYPGPGLGGHCIPIDPFYLTWKAREYGVTTRFIELAGEVNHGMPGWVVGKVADALNDRGKALRGARVLILGVAYKKNVDDSRETPAAEIMELLEGKGAHVSYSDPYIPTFPKMRKHSFDLRSVELTPTTVGQSDCVVLVTEHDSFPYDMIVQNAAVIVDTRGVYRNGEPNVVKA